MVRPSHHVFEVLVPTRVMIEREDGTHFIDYQPPMRRASLNITINWPELLKLATRAMADGSQVIDGTNLFSVIGEWLEPSTGRLERK